MRLRGEVRNVDGQVSRAQPHRQSRCVIMPCECPTQEGHLEPLVSMMVYSLFYNNRRMSDSGFQRKILAIRQEYLRTKDEETALGNITLLTSGFSASPKREKEADSEHEDRQSLQSPDPMESRLRRSVSRNRAAFEVD